MIRMIRRGMLVAGSAAFAGALAFGARQAMAASTDFPYYTEEVCTGKSYSYCQAWCVTNVQDASYGRCVQGYCVCYNY